MFNHVVALTVASIIAFVAANIGDLMVLALFFADQPQQAESDRICRTF
jgi:cadmium resistance protein CadD (predicted permease)